MRTYDKIGHGLFLALEWLMRPIVGLIVDEFDRRSNIPKWPESVRS